MSDTIDAQVERINDAVLAWRYRRPADPDARDSYDSGWGDALTWGWEPLARGNGWTPPAGWRSP